MMFLAVLYPIPNFADTNEKDMVSRFTWLGNGGYSLPYGCRSKERVAILIPYRDREKQLRILLSNLHPLLYRQGLEYRIYVIEQVILILSLFTLLSNNYNNNSDTNNNKSNNSENSINNNLHLSRITQ